MLTISIPILFWFFFCQGLLWNDIFRGNWWRFYWKIMKIHLLGKWDDLRWSWDELLLFKMEFFVSFCVGQKMHIFKFKDFVIKIIVLQCIISYFVLLIVYFGAVRHWEWDFPKKKGKKRNLILNNNSSSRDNLKIISFDPDRVSFFNNNINEMLLQKKNKKKIKSKTHLKQL